MEELAEDNQANSQVKIVKVNVEENPQLSQTFQVASIPAVFVLKAAKVVESIV